MPWLTRAFAPFPAVSHAWCRLQRQQSSLLLFGCDNFVFRFTTDSDLKIALQRRYMKAQKAIKAKEKKGRKKSDQAQISCSPIPLPQISLNHVLFQSRYNIKGSLKQNLNLASQCTVFNSFPGFLIARN